MFALVDIEVDDGGCVLQNKQKLMVRFGYCITPSQCKNKQVKCCFRLEIDEYNENI